MISVQRFGLLSLWTIVFALNVFNTSATTTTNMEKLAEANAEFTLSLLKSLTSKSTGENVFFSPASISMAFAMTYLGSRNETQKQMSRVLAFENLSDDVHATFGTLLTSLMNTEGNYTLHLANRLFVDAKFQLLQEYLKKTSEHYKAEATNVDFQGNAENVRSEINTWVEGQTNKKITNLLPGGSLNALTRLVLVNAIYFKGDWALKFSPESTKSADFTHEDGSKAKVEMMFNKKKYKFGLNRELGNVSAIELPYVGGKMSMFVLLPEKHDGLSALRNSLTAQHLVNIEKTFRMHEMEVHTYIPKFKLEESCKLKEHLIPMGMPDLFDESKCDLGGIETSKMLSVSEAYHKAFIEVNEEGSEAAAATAVTIMLLSMPMTHTFKADRPFMFFIRDNVSKTVLFLGEYKKPSASRGQDEL